MKRLYDKIRTRFNTLFIWPRKLYAHNAIDQHFNMIPQYNTHRANIARSLTRLSDRPLTVSQALYPPVQDRQSTSSTERVPLNYKTCYSVCLWQPYFWLTDTYSALIQGNDQLILLNDTNLFKAAAQADILFLGSGKNFSVNNMLERIDLHNKYVIVISTHSEQDIRMNIKYRIDHYQHAYLIDSQAEFDRLITHILAKATQQD
ncbi:hypothetical protein [Sphingobacterium sp.]|uniref:hypothetical protein n=1 Tax=Sphingobacterium sp. TaxID=341027 RepID=UPI0031D8670D